MSRLSNRKLNKMISDVTSNVEVPNVRDKAKKVPITVTDAKIKKAVPKSVWISAVMCCLIIVCTCLGVLLPNQFVKDESTPLVPPVVNKISYVTVDINPSFTIKLNNDEVISVASNNNDGAIVLSGIDVLSLVGKNYNDAINTLLSESAKTGYLEYGTENLEKQKTRNAVKVAVYSDEDIDLNLIANKMEQACKDYFINNNLFAVVIKDTLTNFENRFTKEYGITYSKYELIKSAYLVQNGFSDVNDWDYKFANFVKDNISTRVSDLYNIIATNKNESIEKVFKVINDAIRDEESYNNYIASVTEINDQLNDFIISKLEKINDFLEEANKQMNEYISNKINDNKLVIKNEIQIIFDEVKNSHQANIEQILKDIDSIKDWIKNNIKASIGLDFDFLDNSQTKTDTLSDILF